VSEYADEVEQAVQTTAGEGWCLGGGVRAQVHDRRPCWVQDLPAAGRPVTLVWVNRVWRCIESRCPRRTWTETSPEIRPRAARVSKARKLHSQDRSDGPATPTFESDLTLCRTT
jgi:transposase